MSGVINPACISLVVRPNIAAHGRHQAENALFSTLELAGGPLLGYDLQQVGRTPPMVVLSSCDLGLADVRPGDETFGMASALLAAGSATVIASVARVADETAMAVMVNFHKAIAAGRCPAAALAGAGPALASTGFVCLGAGSHARLPGYPATTSNARDQPWVSSALRSSAARIWLSHAEGRHHRRPPAPETPPAT